VDVAEFKQNLQVDVKGLQTVLDTEDYTKAVEQAQRDCGWDLPQTTDFRVTWLLRRAKRHLFNMLWTESAHKFKYKQINLQQRFEHYGSLVRFEDREFNKAIEENPAEFAGVSVFKMFGTKIDAGFAYDHYGNDETYDPDQIVNTFPNDAD
jgi:hypothetical protein